MYGRVTKYRHDKNYGFILGEDNQTYFIHQSRLNGEYIDDNYYVSFTPFQTEKGNNAKNITVIEAPEGRRTHGSTRKNMKELNKALQPVMKDMVDKMAERVEQTLNYFLQEYYNSYDPVYYRRLHDFLHSAIKTEPRVVGNKVVASVYIDTDSMDNYYEATGEEVATWANQGTHGGTIRGNNTPHV